MWPDILSFQAAFSNFRNSFDDVHKSSLWNYVLHLMVLFQQGEKLSYQARKHLAGNLKSRKSYKLLAFIKAKSLGKKRLALIRSINCHLLPSTPRLRDRIARCSSCGKYLVNITINSKQYGQGKERGRQTLIITIVDRLTRMSFLTSAVWSLSQARADNDQEREYAE